MDEDFHHETAPCYDEIERDISAGTHIDVEATYKEQEVLIMCLQ